MYREKYFDFNVQHFHEKLEEKPNIHFSYTWVKTALQKAGLVKRARSAANIGSGAPADPCRE